MAIIKKPELTTKLLTALIQLLPFNKQERKQVSKQALLVLNEATYNTVATRENLRFWPSFS